MYTGRSPRATRINRSRKRLIREARASQCMETSVKITGSRAIWTEFRQINRRSLEISSRDNYRYRLIRISPGMQRVYGACLEEDAYQLTRNSDSEPFLGPRCSIVRVNYFSDVKFLGVITERIGKRKSASLLLLRLRRCSLIFRFVVLYEVPAKKTPDSAREIKMLFAHSYVS